MLRNLRGLVKRMFGRTGIGMVIILSGNTKLVFNTFDVFRLPNVIRVGMNNNSVERNAEIFFSFAGYLFLLSK